MQLAELKNCKYGLTHNGTFHADDVFATAFIKLINPDIEIIRSKEVTAQFKGIVYDIGGGKFDHHSKNNETRSNSIPYAAFGKLWKAFAKDLYGEYVYQKIDKRLIQYLDLSDNTGSSDTLCLAIASFNPLDSWETGDQEFNEAVNIAKRILDNLIKCEQKNYEEELKVKKIYEESQNKEIIILAEHLHFTDTLPNTQAKYVVYPSKRGGYIAQGVPINADTVELKKPFLRKWTEKLPSYLTFCHTSRFLIAGNTLEDVIRACNVALKDGE